MTKQGFAMLQDVIMDDSFPDLDLALRRGRHIDRDDADWYALLSDAQEQLELFYRRYGCELIHKTDGYFYLLPTGDKLSRRQLAPGDMLVGQALALLYLDPATIERGGLITQEELVAQLSSVLGSDALIGAFNPKRKRYDERIAQKNVRSRVAESVRRLASLGFIQVAEDERLRLRPALMRFAEPVRAASEPTEALAKLVAQGEVALVPEEGAQEPEDGFEAFEADEEAGEPSALRDEAEARGAQLAADGGDDSRTRDEPSAESAAESAPIEPASAAGVEEVSAPEPPREPGAAAARAEAMLAGTDAREPQAAESRVVESETPPAEHAAASSAQPAPAAKPAAAEERELDWDDLDVAPSDPDAEPEDGA